MMEKGLVVLLDCNNFFVSCERVFRPDLLNKPVVVLSSNDGCVVARSNEAKALGIPMGVPFFQIKELVKKEQVEFFSGNFPLYEDISRRVMKVAEELSDKIERYSIDESFLFLYGEEREIIARVNNIKVAVERGTGIPISIGVANTKTLAKLASGYAKKNPGTNGVFFLNEDVRAEFLKNIQIGEVWGVGGKTSLKLNRAGVRSARDLTDSSDEWVRGNLGVGTLRTAFELRGMRALTKSEVTKGKQSILSSRSFGKKTSRQNDLEEAVASHVVRAASKMRRDKNVASYISVYIRTARQGASQGRNFSQSRELFFPTDDTLTLISQAHDILNDIFIEGVSYSKAGILLSGFSPKRLMPTQSLFEKNDSNERSKLMSTLDAIEKKYGKNTIFPAATGIKQSWAQRQEFRSPNYTTDWKSLPKVRA